MRDTLDTLAPPPAASALTFGAPGASASGADRDGTLTERRRTWLWPILAEAFLLYTFIGFNPFPTFSPQARLGGDSLDRIAVVAMAALALVAIARNARAAAECLRSNVLLTLVLVWLQLSIVWSDHPDLTIRRASFVLLIGVIALGIAAGASSLRAFHTLTFATLSAIIAFNLVGVVLWPQSAISDIGVMGIYGQKNVAGMVAMLTLVISVTWICGASSWRGAALGILPTLLTLDFLWMTQSKTSIAIAVLALLLGGLVWLSLIIGRRMVLLMFAGVLLGLCVLIGLFVVNDFDVDAVLGLFVTDTSFTGRSELWDFAWARASERMWLGHGYGAFWDVGLINDPLAKLEPGTWLGDVQKGVINQAHNGYLELWLNAGLPATLTAVAGVCVAMLSATGLAIGAHPDHRTRATYGLAALVLFMYLIHNFTEATLFQRGSQFFNMVLLVSFLTSRRDFWPIRATG